METSREQIREMHRDSVRLAFMRAAEKLIAERGFEKTSVHDIAKATGYSAGAFYQFFQSKEQMYEELVSHHCGELIRRLRESRAVHERPMDQFRAAIKALAAYFNENRDFFRIYYMLTPGWDLSRKDSGSSARRMLEEFLVEIEGMYEKGRATGDFRADIPARLMVQFAHGVISSLLLHWSSRSDGAAVPTPAEQERILVELILGGIGRRA